MKLVEAGKLKLSDPLSKYIPEFKDVKVGVEKLNSDGKAELTLVNANRAITIQDLLRHTSGLTYGYFDNTLVDKTYLENHISDSDQTLEQQVLKLAKMPLKFQPGSTWNYGLSADVLGRVIEIITGKSLDLALQDMVTVPLKMNDTNFWIAEDKYPRAAFSNGVNKYQPPKKKPSLLSGGAGLYTTAHDYARFCQMLLNKGQLEGVRILSRKSVELMTADNLPSGVYGAKASDMIRPENGLSFGLGFAIRTEQGRNGLLGSKGEYFWLGASGTNFVIDPTEKMITLLLIYQPEKMVDNLHLMRNMGNALIND
jgi:CubicO group peptidase (beta-lactamase class C family)